MSSTPPADSPSDTPSPVVSVGASVQCSRARRGPRKQLRGAGRRRWGNRRPRAARRFRARTVTSPPGPSSTAPVTAPSSVMQPRRRRVHHMRHAELVGRLGQPGDQRRPVHQLHAAPVGEQVQHVERDAPPGVEEPLDRRRGVQERLQVRTGHDPQPEERRLVELGANSLARSSFLIRRMLIGLGPTDRPPVPAPGRSPWMSAIQRAGDELQRVWFSKNATMCRAFSSSASTRGSS